MAKAELGQISGLGFPEALRWRAGELWFSDMFRGQVMAWSPGQQPRVVLSSKSGGPEMPGGLGWKQSGELLVVDCLERRVLKLGHDGKISVHADFSSLTAHPLNDMHVDLDGTAWIGGYGFDPDFDEPVGSPIFRVSEAGEISQSEPRFLFPNGCERRASELAVAETFGDRVSFFNSDFGHRESFDCAAGSGPDGLTFDTNGFLYVAMAFSSKIERLSAAGEFEVVFELDTPSESPGGPKGVFDCAMKPGSNILAFSSACLDEAYSKRQNTGSITLLGL